MLSDYLPAAAFQDLTDNSYHYLHVLVCSGMFFYSCLAGTFCFQAGEDLIYIVGEMIYIYFAVNTEKDFIRLHVSSLETSFDYK